MDPQVAAQRAATPMTERLVRYLQSTQDSRDGIGLYYDNNVLAYHWRMFELAHPWVAKLAGLFRFGPKIAFGL